MTNEWRRRFILDGRIEQYPAKPAALGEHLALVVDDVVTLRRHLVDSGNLSRAPDGAVYEVVPRGTTQTD